MRKLLRMLQLNIMVKFVNMSRLLYTMEIRLCQIMVMLGQFANWNMLGSV
jgi:hypothetical protein